MFRRVITIQMTHVRQKCDSEITDVAGAAGANVTSLGFFAITQQTLRVLAHPWIV
jgi:hypothetical protein